MAPRRASAAETVAGHVLSGADLNFYCLDLTNTARIRTLETPAAVWLLLCQAEDREWDRIAPVFAAIWFTVTAGILIEFNRFYPDLLFHPM